MSPASPSLPEVRKKAVLVYEALGLSSVMAGVRASLKAG